MSVLACRSYLFDLTIIKTHRCPFTNTNNRQGLRVLKVTGIVRAYPIVYYSKRARNAMINYSKTLPSVMLWIGT